MLQFGLLGRVVVGAPWVYVLVKIVIGVRLPIIWVLPAHNGVTTALYAVRVTVAYTTSLPDASAALRPPVRDRLAHEFHSALQALAYESPVGVCQIEPHYNSMSEE